MIKIKHTGNMICKCTEEDQWMKKKKKYKNVRNHHHFFFFFHAQIRRISKKMAWQKKKEKWFLVKKIFCIKQQKKKKFRSSKAQKRLILSRKNTCKYDWAKKTFSCFESKNRRQIEKMKKKTEILQIDQHIEIHFFLLKPYLLDQMLYITTKCFSVTELSTDNCSSNDRFSLSSFISQRNSRSFRDE